ncbi:MAG: hypothetical protein OEN02_02180 [Gammaproteobacteria bacterium]|nr:hypothetical protein [Gammaproteobacteria bacterium]MDH3534722.1 hypothetical protein [Gammaproteobacteria bacterium]
MLTIKRTCSNRIITRALESEGRPLLALLMPGAEDCEICAGRDQLQAGLAANPEAMIVYNQQADAIAQVESLAVPPEQVFIEVRQDTKGVLGLEAYHKKGHQPEALELFHE